MADELPIPPVPEDEVQALLERELTLTPVEEALAEEFREGLTAGDAEPGELPGPPV